MKTKIIQFSAGRGPAECAWVVAKVLKYFIEALNKNGFNYKILHKVNGLQNGTVKSVSIQIDGKQLTPFLQTWLGSIQWVGTSTFRKHHKRKNWFISCYEVSIPQQSQINSQHISFTATKSSGPGGQHVNKTNSAIRAIHQPSGLSVQVMDSRSQHQNKKIAINRLTAKLKEVELENAIQFAQQTWENGINIKRGNPIRVFKGTDFKQQPQKKKYKQERSSQKRDWKKLIS
jgi:peptide chain release factor